MRMGKEWGKGQLPHLSTVSGVVCQNFGFGFLLAELCLRLESGVRTCEVSISSAIMNKAKPTPK